LHLCARCFCSFRDFFTASHPGHPPPARKAEPRVGRLAASCKPCSSVFLISCARNGLREPRNCPGVRSQVPGVRGKKDGVRCGVRDTGNGAAPGGDENSPPGSPHWPVTTRHCSWDLGPRTSGGFARHLSLITRHCSSRYSSLPFLIFLARHSSHVTRHCL
jgi:hypothetical protein